MRQLACLLRRENDIGIIRQDKYVPRVNLVDGGGDGFDARIHRLPAGDQRIHRQRFKEFVNALSRADGEKTEFLFVALALRHEFAVLFAHILDFELVQLSQAQRHLQHLARRVGVDMHLDHICIVRNDDGIPKPLQMIAEALDFLFIGLR
ncbi:hypothetical protein SDC9_160224 [bioreactor metagenome]|uniref:Uncharacterized protein n=1 Tax=bioreactor metagenome TaxID=1076179 RepID=A0A645FKG0_9ZZZZ